MLGRYQILKPLAKGGMAEVLLARTLGIKGFERYVVIKRIRVERGSDERAIEMFLDEARLVAALHHRNIVQVHDVGEENEKYFLVMEYVHGRDTRELLRSVKEQKQQIPLEHVITIVTAAAAGLHYAHEQRGADRKPLGIVHRDVSPGNILLAFDGGVKVVDFGIAKTLNRSIDTGAGATKGKVGYMSPEQCRAQPIDRRTDTFLLGIVMWELCTVRRLFNKDGRFETMAVIVDGEVPPPTRFRSDLPADLEAIILKALAKRPEERYQTADELRLALEAFAARAGLTISPGRLSDYLKVVFGEVPEPWLVEDVPPPPPDAMERVRRSQQMLAVSPEAAELVPAEPVPAEPVANVEADDANERANVEPPATTVEARPAKLEEQPANVETEPTKRETPPAQPLRLQSPTAWPVDPSSERRRKTWWFAIGLLVVGMTAFLVIAFTGGDRVGTTQSTPQTPTVPIEPSPAPAPSVVAPEVAKPEAVEAVTPVAIDAGAHAPVIEHAPTNAEVGSNAAPIPEPSPSANAAAKPAIQAPKPKPKRPRPKVIAPKPVDSTEPPPAAQSSEVPADTPADEPAPPSTDPTPPPPP